MSTLVATELLGTLGRALDEPGLDSLAFVTS
jgi:hypothetical protein